MSKDLDRLLELSYEAENSPHEKHAKKCEKEFNSLKSKLGSQLKEWSQHKITCKIWSGHTSFQYNKMKQQVNQLQEELTGLKNGLKVKHFSKLKKENQQLKEELNKINDIVGHVTIDEIISENGELESKVKALKAMLEDNSMLLHTIKINRNVIREENRQLKKKIEEVTKFRKLIVKDINKNKNDHDSYEQCRVQVLEDIDDELKSILGDLK